MRKSLTSFACEPLVRFLAAGLLIWGGVEYLNSHEDRYQLDIGPAEQRRIVSIFAQQFGRPPSEAQLASLIDRHVREEIFLREGLALGLEKNDEIVRRRIVQKYEFLQTDLAVPAAPSTSQLQAWFEQHRSRYLTAPCVSFRHIYFSIDEVGVQGARQRAARMLKRLRAAHFEGHAGSGDSFPGPADVNASTQLDAITLFGHSELSARLFDAPLGQWSGPYRSGYGWHLVYVTTRLPATLPPLAQIRDQVLTDYQEEQRRLANERSFEKLKEKYTIRHEGVHG